MRRCSSLLRGSSSSLSGYLAKLWSYSVLTASGPHEVLLVDHLAHHVQVRRLLQVEHLPADERRRLREPVHRQRAQDRVRLDADVVVHEQDLFAVGVFQRLVHHPAVAAGAAEVGLVVDGQPVAQRGGGGLEPGMVLGLLGALVGDDHRADHLVHQRIRGQCGQRVDAVRRPVERRDADRDVGPAGCGLAARTSPRCAP